jgi:2-hydroxy-6-oxonona-2,4-dienedioate hydrolase
MGSRSCSSG